MNREARQSSASQPAVVMQGIANAELASRSLRGAWAYPATALLVVFASDIASDHLALGLVGAGLFLIGAIARIQTSRRFETIHARSGRLWFRIFAAAVLAPAATWGLFALLAVIHYGASWTSVCIFLVLAGLAAGGAGTLAPTKWVFRAFYLTMLAPSVLYLIATGARESIGLGVILLMDILFLWSLGNHFHRSYWAGLHDRRLLVERAAQLERAHTEIAAANMAKSEFLANMSHEIRTPMNGVIGLTELVLESELDQQQREYLTDAQLSARSLMRIINDILDFSRIEAGQLSVIRAPFSLADLVERVLRPIQLPGNRQGVGLHSEIAAGVPDRLIGDAGRLGQILTNLVQNAVKFTEDGEIALLIDVESESKSEEVCLHFAIRDSGIGIAEEDQLRIFDAFRQVDGSARRSRGGTGLGLTITASLVRLLGGDLWLESEPGRGSAFHVRLTFARNDERLDAGSVSREEAAEDVGIAEVSGSRRGASVLLVEDNAINRKLATALLEGQSVRVTVAENGAEAVAATEAERHDLVLMDIQMPVMDGLTAIREIRAREGEAGWRIPIVALTAHALVGDRDRCLAAGADDYLAKPVDAVRLRAMVEKWIPPTGSDPASSAGAAGPGARQGDRVPAGLQR